jgi:hypothetical protein
METQMHHSLLSVFLLSSHWSSVDMELWSVQEQIVVTVLYIKTNIITTVQCGYQKLTFFLNQSFGSSFYPMGLSEGQRCPAHIPDLKQQIHQCLKPSVMTCCSMQWLDCKVEYMHCGVLPHIHTFLGIVVWLYHHQASL